MSSLHHIRKMNQIPEQQTSKKVERPRIRDLGYSPGKFPPGPQNSILDVEGKLNLFSNGLKLIKRPF